MSVRLEPGYSLLTLAWLLAIGWLSSLPDHGPVQAAPVQLLWNLAHVPFFAGLAFCVLKSLRADNAWRARYALAFVVSMACAVLDEWHQSFVPGRQPSLGDLLLDLAGIAGVLVVMRVRDRVKELPANALGRMSARE